MKRKLGLIKENVYWPWSVGIFKPMVSVDNTRNGLIAINEALKKEGEDVKVTEKLFQNNINKFIWFLASICWNLMLQCL
jgi:hypothetical protein